MRITFKDRWIKVPDLDFGEIWILISIPQLKFVKEMGYISFKCTTELK